MSISIRICTSYEEMSELAAIELYSVVLNKPAAVLGLATGSTPIGTYEALIRLQEMHPLNLKELRTVNLDEYLGLPGDHPQSYRYFMDTNLFRSMGLSTEQTFVPNGLAENPEAEGLAYDARIDAMGGIDLQILGLGHNGHIAFNEPCEDFPKHTHPVDLQENTIQANARFFDSMDEVPRRALTMGIGSIFKARRILLLVNGAAKANILKEALEGPVTPMVPASILQLHPNVLVLCDKEAGSLLSQEA